MWKLLSVALLIGCANTSSSAQDFVIVAAMGGGCGASNACPSYQLLGDGISTYTQPGRFGGAGKTQTGALSGEQMLALSGQVTQRRLDLLAASEFKGTCPSNNDGEDNVFEITLEGQKTRLYTSEHSLSGDPLVSGLIGLFGAFAGEMAKIE